MPKSVDELVSSVTQYAPTYGGKARRLCAAVQTNQNIDWDEETGNVVIRGRPIPESNVTDIVHDLIRNWKRPPPPGSVEVARELMTSGTMPAVITNSVRQKEILNEQSRRDPRHSGSASRSGSFFSPLEASTPALRAHLSDSGASGSRSNTVTPRRGRGRRDRLFTSSASKGAQTGTGMKKKSIKKLRFASLYC